MSRAFIAHEAEHLSVGTTAQHTSAESHDNRQRAANRHQDQLRAPLLSIMTTVGVRRIGSHALVLSIPPQSGAGVGGPGRILRAAAAAEFGLEFAHLRLQLLIAGILASLSREVAAECDDGWNQGEDRDETE